MAQRENLTEQAKFSLTRRELDLLQRIADDESRSLASVIRFAVREYLTGYEVGRTIVREFPATKEA